MRNEAVFLSFSQFLSCEKKSVEKAKIGKDSSSGGGIPEVEANVVVVRVEVLAVEAKVVAVAVSVISAILGALVSHFLFANIYRFFVLL